MPSSRLILCRPLLLLPPIPPRIRVFSKESTLRMRWPKYWSGHCAKHPQSSFLLPLYLPSGSSLDYFAVLFFISVGHSRALRKEISLGYSLKGLMLKLKLQYFGHLVGITDSLEKTLMLGKIEGRRSGGRQRVRWLDCISDSMDMS